MNVLTLLDNEIKDKDWTLAEKARYLYLRTCELFSYDPQYEFYPNYLSEEEANKIKYRPINLEEIDNFNVLCISYAYDILSEIYEKLLGIKTNVRGTGHHWVEFNDGLKNIDADTADLARVKMGLHTNGYKTTRDYNFNDYIKRIDKKIGYIKEDYHTHEIYKKANSIVEEFKKYNGADSSLYPDALTIYKINEIQAMRENYTLKNIMDEAFCITYLGKKFGIDFKEVNLFNVEGNLWYYLNLYMVELGEENLYYLLEPENKGYNFYEISKDDANFYARTLKGIHKENLMRK